MKTYTLSNGDVVSDFVVEGADKYDIQCVEASQFIDRLDENLEIVPEWIIAPDDVLDMITEELSDVLYEIWYDDQIGRAEAYYEGDR